MDVEALADQKVTQLLVLVLDRGPGDLADQGLADAVELRGLLDKLPLLASLTSDASIGQHERQVAECQEQRSRAKKSRHQVEPRAPQAVLLSCDSPRRSYLGGRIPAIDA
jgi:hypothetical protein